VNIPSLPDHIVAVVFDIGDTLVHAAPPGTAVDVLEATPRPAVLDDLRRLRSERLRLAAVTDTAVMTESDVRALLAPVGLDELLEVVVTSVDVGAAKPNPTSLRTALDRLGVEPEQAIYIGDRVVDRDAARAAGTAFAFVRDTLGDTLSRWVAEPSRRFDTTVAAWTDAHAQRAERWAEASAAARARLDSLAKPPGSLGRLEALAVQLAAVAGTCPPSRPSPAHVVVFAADHGVHAEGVTAWPQEITGAMVEAMAASRASINALGDAVGATVSVVDVGVGGPPSTSPLVVRARVRAGTRNLAVEPAMTLAEASDALDVGVEMAERARRDGAGCLVTGEMGIANTTAATALICALTGRSPDELTGRGAGADDETLERKRRVIAGALDRSRGSVHALELLASLGGLEIAAMAGFIVGGATSGVPVVVDGVIADAALLCAEALVPGVVDHVIAGHRSTEPAASAALEHLRLEPVLDLGMRLGEGTGAVLVTPLLDGAWRLLTEVATIADLTGDD
jgi:nicotinate-nucleotide--dimethylbenzimidazole phosphoribosyltransferase